MKDKIDKTMSVLGECHASIESLFNAGVVDGFTEKS